MKDRQAGFGDTGNPVGRRRFLQIGGWGCLGINLPLLLNARNVQAAVELPNQPKPRIRSCIVIFYYGGPSHLDMFDMKPEAPAEIRGEFNSIATTVPGLRICEHLPHMATVMHKVALVRSLHHGMRLHDAACVATLTGRLPARGDGENFIPPAETDLFPCYGSALSYLRREQSLPVSHAALPYVINNVIPVPCQTGGFLGSAYDPFRINGDPDTLTYRAEMLHLPADLTQIRLSERETLLRSIDLAERVTSSARATLLRAHYEKAFELLASDAVRQALDIEQEDETTRERFGRGKPRQDFQDGPTGDNGAELGLGRNMRGQNLLLARRLVEAGVPFVNVFDFKQQGKNWDAHTDNFAQHKNHLLPPFDRALAALIEDLDEHGLLDSTLVVALGEFGRTPKINARAGRDHWPDCYTALLAGGGIKGGFAYGTSDKIGAYPDLDPVTPGDLAATIFHRFGIDPATEIHDALNRPYKVADGQPLVELFL